MKKLMSNVNLLIFALLSVSSVAHTSISQLALSRFQKSPAKPSVEVPHTQVDRFLKKIEGLEALRAQIQSQYNFSPLITQYLATIEQTKYRINRGPTREQDFRTALLSLANQTYQILIESDQELQQFIRTIDTHVKLIQEYLSNKDFKHLTVPVKAYYGFDDVQDLAHKFVEIKTRLADAERTKASTLNDLNKRKRTLALITDEYNEKKRQQEEFSQKLREAAKKQTKFTQAQQGELIDNEERLAFHKKQLAELKVTESENNLNLIDDSLFIYRAQFNVIKKEYSRIKNIARVGTSFVKKTDELLEKQREASVAHRDRINDKIHIITTTTTDIKKNISDIQRQLYLSAADIAAIGQLSTEPKNRSEWHTFASLLNLLTEESLLEIEREYLLAQIDLEKAKFNKEEIGASIVHTWNKMTEQNVRFETEEQVETEIKTYELSKAELDAHIATLTNLRDAAINNLHAYTETLNKIKTFTTALQNKRTTFFKDYSENYESIVKALYEIEEKIRRRLDWTAKLIEEYSNVIATVQESIKKVENITDELRSKSFWRRSNQSIEFHELKNFIPDIERFIRDMQRSTVMFFSSDRIHSFGKFLHTVATEPLFLFLWIIRLLLVLIGFFLLRLYIPDIEKLLERYGQGYSFIHELSVLSARLLHFIHIHLKGVYGWCIIFVFIKLNIIPDTYFAQFFYITSIPYLLFLINRFTIYWQIMNEQKNYRFISEAYQARFLWVMSTLLYLITTIACIRQAFILGGYNNSHVPIILLALIFILCQVALISLIGKEQILGFLHKDTPLWEWIYEHVSRYYYLVWLAFIAIIVMSNPYVGYGRQVFYILSRLFLTIGLIPLLVIVHNRIKRMSLDLFFYYTDSEAIKERFVSGRLWYGLFVISSFVFFIIAGLYFAARMWNTPISLRYMASWLYHPFYTPSDEAGREIQVTVASLMQIVVYLFGGLSIAYILNSFVFRRVLDPFLVGTGVQNMILTLTRYVIVIFALFMGLNSAGLEGLTTKLAILLAGISFAAQEAVRDFFSYLILLVQRPVKIGDFIEVIDGNREGTLTGFVRNITPRSIMIRRRNSVTIIIPNSRVVMNPIINWSYSKSFIAFEDMLMTVPYTTDPQQVRRIILEVLDKSITVLKTPPPVVRLEHFVDNGYQFLIRGYLAANKVGDQWDIASDVRFELVCALRAHNIEIASPIRTIKMTGAEQKIQ